MSSLKHPCAACKLHKRKCDAKCILAPHFPPDQPQKIGSIYKIYGRKNLVTILNKLHVDHYTRAVETLYDEAQMRIRDPVNGSVGVICDLQNRLNVLSRELEKTREEICFYRERMAGDHWLRNRMTVGNPTVKEPSLVSDVVPVCCSSRGSSGLGHISYGGGDAKNSQEDNILRRW